MKTCFVLKSLKIIAHFFLGQISSRAGQKGPGRRQTECPGSQDQLQLQEDPWQDLLHL